MINIDEFSKAKEVLDLLKEKTSENERLIDEKTKSINETFNSYFNKKDLSIDMTQKEMIESITYDKAINKIANRQLNRYFLMLDKPYFGRVDFENEWGEIAYYFGIESLLKNNEVIVNDWRSPIGNLYYEGVYGKSSYVSPKGLVEGNITLKRQYRFDKGELKHYVDTGLSISDELLIDVLGKNNDVVMKNIVSTIQKEQNEAIRYNNDNDLLVLGVAGSGKTSIALHRIAYLVYKDSIKYDSSKVCFITPNDIFFRYIDNVLPELGEDNVVNLTLNEVARTIMKMDLYRYKLRVENKVDFLEKVMNGKKSFDFDDWFNKLNDFLNKKMETLFVDRLGLKIGDISFRSEIFRELYFNKFNRRDYSERRRFIKEYLKDRVSTRRKVTKNIVDIIDAFVNRLLPEVNYFEVYQEFLDSIGYKEEVIKRRIIGYEHIYCLCYVKIFFKKCKLFEKYNHLLIDEYQDLNVIERNVIQRIFNCNKTFVGDINQKLFKQDYDKLLTDFKLIELNSSYRSTIEIFNFLQNIIKNDGVNNIKRHGKEVVFRCFDTKEKEITYLKETISNYDGKSMAIICRNQKEASKLSLLLKDHDNVSLLNVKGKGVIRGIVIGSISLIKGLEFDKVIVYDSNSNNYSSDIEKNYFYIACSRAINELEVISSYDLTSFIKKY